MSKNKKSKEKDFDKMAEEILNNLVQEESKKESKKENKKTSKNKSKTSKNESKKTSKNDASWIKDDHKFSNKVIKISSPIWFMQMNIMGEHHNYQITHKKESKKCIKIKLQNDNCNFEIKCNKKKNGFDFTVNKVVIDTNSKEKYDKEYIQEYGNVIPFEIILAPIVDFYFNTHTSLLTDGNCKEIDNQLIIDANIRKMGYKISPRDLSIEELDDLNRDFDNRLACSLEYFRRFAIVKDEEAEETKAEKPKAEETKAEKPKAEETKAEETKAEKPKAEETKAEETKAEETKAEETKAEETKAEETAEETKAEKSKAKETAEETKAEKSKAKETAEETKAEETKAEETKAEKSKAKETKAEETKAEETKAEKSKAEETKAEKSKAKETAEEKIIEYITSHDSDIKKALKDCSNVAERGRCFIQHLIQKLVPSITVDDIIVYLTLNKLWEFYVFESINVIEIRRTQMLEFMISQTSVSV